MESRTDIRMTAFHDAAMIGSEETVRTLISYGAALDALDRFKNTALNFVCQEGHLSCVLSLIQAGASTIIPNTDGNFPIHIASAANRAAVVWVLVNHGSDKEQASNN